MSEMVRFPHPIQCGYQEKSKSLTLELACRGGELLITIVGTVGETAIVPQSLAGWNVARAIAVVPVRADVGAYWIQLALKSPLVRSRIDSRLNTTVQATLNLRDVAQLPILLPPAPERARIMGVLGALEEKIELNRRMNETLEAMARAIFQDWFVDFGPTRAKAEGRAPYLEPGLWSLFPGSFNDDDNPEGWIGSAIGDEVDAVGGSTPSTTDRAFWDGDVRWATPKDLSSLRSPVLLETERHITQAGLEQISSGLLPAGTVLLSSRAPIGYLAIAEVPTAVNQGFIALVCRRRLSNVFAWLWCHLNMDTILQHANGSTFQEISKRSFRPLPVIVPSAQVLQAFDCQAKPMYELIAANERESRTLIQTRDLLLPKLMSGEIHVKEAERIMAEVA